MTNWKHFTLKILLKNKISRHDFRDVLNIGTDSDFSYLAVNINN